ncbi:CxC2 domain-containing protein [Mycena indigotica]|uniref:CxC2 domain-containing protein n=1 Tax=Mycena indigotica TaxID=2126181 RepID=A0A8H6W417_9AGAR|nr:CxC2 domain-containing protein [Mycena indigotica]KAF7304157.1 CxC2 domain-containing protein [Mycena indigotica]
MILLVNGSSICSRGPKVIAKDNPTITTDLHQYDIDFALPVWHAVVHEPTCQAKYSLSYLRGVGRTDGEGIERTWSILNPISFATKEMGEGNRHDTIDDKLDHINFEKNMLQGQSLCRKLIVAIAECDRQTQQFIEMDESLNEECRERWRAVVDKWELDKTQPNPYLMQNGKLAGPSESQIMAELRKEELTELREGRAVVEGKMTAASFVKAKLQLEALQERRLRRTGGVNFDELRISFFKKLRTVQKLEETFMPGVLDIRQEEEELRDPDIPAPSAEHVRSRPGFVHGQCTDALAALRGRIHAMTHLILFRNSQVVGQKRSTRSNMAVARMAERKHADAAKYRQAWRAMRTLVGPTYAPELRELQDADLNDRTEVEEDAEARARLGQIGSTRRVRTEPSLSRTTSAVSWIWFVGGHVDAGEIHDGMFSVYSGSLAECHIRCTGSMGEGAGAEGSVDGGGGYVTGGDEARFAKLEKCASCLAESR